VKKRFGEEQIVGFLAQADQRQSVRELCRKRGFSEGGFCLWSRVRCTSDLSLGALGFVESSFMR
jgi:hypothetical protein